MQAQLPNDPIYIFRNARGNATLAPRSLLWFDSPTIFASVLAILFFFSSFFSLFFFSFSSSTMFIIEPRIIVRWLSLEATTRTHAFR